MRKTVTVAIYLSLLAVVLGIGVTGWWCRGQSNSAVTDRRCVAGIVTFNKDVAPIIFESCAICHRPSGSAPFALLGYRDVRKFLPDGLQHQQFVYIRIQHTPDNGVELECVVVYAFCQVSCDHGVLPVAVQACPDSSHLDVRIISGAEKLPSLPMSPPWAII